jgi:hypothetical protein
MDDTAAPAATAAPDRVIGTAHSYDELIDAFRKRCDEFGATRESIDHLAGLPAGYCSKVFAHKPVKGFGRVSLGPLLGALGLKLVIVEDAEALAKVKLRLAPCVYAGSRVLARKRRKRFSLFRGNPDLARKIRHLQILEQTPQQRQRIARKAASARWAKRQAGRPGTARPVDCR